MVTIIENSKILSLLNRLQGNDFDGMTLGSHIHLRGKAVDDVVLVNHEMIHTHQFKEVGFIKFIVTYYIDYIKNRWMGMSELDSYLNTRAEIEAYEYENSYTRYMRRRVPYEWLKIK